MKRLPLWLAVSVILNLFLVGALAGGAWLVRSRSPMIFAGSLRIAGAELPDNERRAFRAAMRAERHAHRAELHTAQAARLQAAALLRAPTVNEAAVIAALAQARIADVAVRGAVEDRAVRFSATLPSADRAKLADAMAERAKKGRP